MARLPTRDDLRGPASFRTGTRVSAPDLSGLTRGIEGLGASISQLGAEQQDQNRAVDIARAEAFKAKSFLDVENEFDNDPDYATHGERSQKKSSDVVKAGADLIRDDKARELWTLKAGTDAARLHDRIGDRATQKRRAAEITALDEALRVSRNVYVDPTSSDEERQAARENIEGSIGVSLESGLLSAPQASDMRTTYLSNADYERGKLAVESGSFDGPLPEGGATDVIRSFEGFSESPYADYTIRDGVRVNSGNRIGYGSDTITREDGTVEKVRPGMVVTRADAERDLNRRAKEFEAVAAGQVGADAWGKLSDGARAALTSVAYNYGSMPDRILDAVRGGNNNEIANAVAALQDDNGGINRNRRLKEAAIIRGDTNPAWFNRLTPEQKSDLVSRDRTRSAAIAREEQSAATAQSAALKADLEQRILLGDTSVTEQTILDSGMSTENENTLLRQLETAGTDRRITQGAIAKLLEGDAFDPFSSDDKKAVGLAYDSITNGESLFDGGNAPAVLGEVFSKSGIMPQTATNQLRGALRSGDPNKVGTAASIASALAGISRPMLQSSASGKELSEVATAYDHYTDSLGLTPDEAGQRIIDSGDPAKIKERQYITGTDAVKKFVKGIEAHDVSSKFGGTIFGIGVPQLGNNATAESVMLGEYKQIFQDSIVESNGDTELASKLAFDRFSLNYGTSNLLLDLENVVTFLPPEKTYPPAPDGTYDYIRKQAGEVLEEDGIAFDEVFLQVFDDTEQDFRSGSGASYQIMYRDNNGAIGAYPHPFTADHSIAVQEHVEAQELAQEEMLGEIQERKQGIVERGETRKERRDRAREKERLEAEQ